MADKPFFVYFALGATHAPHHVTPERSAKYKRQFDQGWDRLREETLARQKELGVVPPEAELTARPARLEGCPGGVRSTAGASGRSREIIGSTPVSGLRPACTGVPTISHGGIA